MLSIFILSVVNAECCSCCLLHILRAATLNIITPSVVYSARRYSERRSAECRSDECRGTPITPHPLPAATGRSNLNDGVPLTLRAVICQNKLTRRRHLSHR